MLQKVVRKSFPLPNVHHIKSIPNKNIIERLKQNSIRAGWQFHDSTGSVDICSDTENNVLKVYNIIAQLECTTPPSPIHAVAPQNMPIVTGGGHQVFGLPHSNLQEFRSSQSVQPQVAFGPGSHSIKEENVIQKAHLQSNLTHSHQLAQQSLHTTIKHDLEGHIARYLKAKKLPTVLRAEYDVEVNIDLKAFRLSLEGTAKNVEAADTELKTLINSLSCQRVSLSPTYRLQLESLDRRIVFAKLDEAHITARWCINNSQLLLCSNNKENTDHALGIILSLANCSELMPESARSRHSFNDLNEEIVSHKLSCGIEKLRYFKTLKYDKEIELACKVSVAVDLGSQCLEVKGQKTKVLEAIKRLNDIVKNFVTKCYLRAEIFTKCLKNVKNVDIIAALRNGQVKAGWDVTDDQLVVCGDNENSVDRASSMIDKLVVVSNYPETTLSPAEIKATEMTSQWSSLLQKLMKKNVQVEVDYRTSKVDIAMAASENKMAVKFQLDQFFAPIRKQSHLIPLSAVCEQLFLLNLDHITPVCQTQGNKTVTVSIENQSCCLTSLASSSLSAASQKVEQILSNVCVRTKNVKPSALNAWLLTEPAKNRVQEIANIFYVIINPSQQNIATSTGNSSAIKIHNLTAVEADISTLTVSFLFSFLSLCYAISKTDGKPTTVFVAISGFIAFYYKFILLFASVIKLN